MQQLNSRILPKQLELILNCLSGAKNNADGIVEANEALKESDIWLAANQNKVAPMIAHAFIDVFGENNIPLDWLDLHERNKRQISAYLKELDCISILLRASGVDIIAIENSMLARAVHDCPGCFSFGDLDVLTVPEKLSTIHNILTTEGYTFKTPSDDKISEVPDLANGRAEYATNLPDGAELRVNVQWSLVARRWFAANREPDIHALFARSVPIPGSAARMLAPEDNLFQLAVHNASHAYVRKPGIRLHLDIHRFVSKIPVNWPIFIAMAEQYRVKTSVYFSLLFPKVLLGTPIPSHVLDQLRPPAWKERLISRWLEKVGIFNPDEPKFGRLEFILFTAMLYDDTGGLWRGIFPDSAWMQKHYGFTNKLLLPLYHGRRIANLAFRRVSS